MPIDLTPQQAHKELVHERYKDLAAVERAFRTCKTAHLAVRPIFVRCEARTRSHAFVVILAYQIIQYLTACWSPLDITVAEGLHALTTLWRVAAGFALGVAAGTVLGALAGYSGLLHRLVDPTLQALRSIPSIAWADGLVVVAKDSTGVAAGSIVEVMPL